MLHNHITLLLSSKEIIANQLNHQQSAFLCDFFFATTIACRMHKVSGIFSPSYCAMLIIGIYFTKVVNKE